MGLRKYDRDNSSALPYGVTFLYSKVKEHAPWITRTRRLSYTETIARLNLATSCGFPLNQNFRNKRSYLLMVDIEEEMLDYENWLLANPDVPCCFWSSFLKDEVVPLRKVKEPRQINCPSLFYLILFSSFVLDYNDQYVEGWSRSDSEHAVGIDVRSFDWHILMQRVLKFVYNLSLDHKSFDSTIHRSWFDAIYMHRVELMELTPRETALFRRCYKDARDSFVILCNGEIFRVFGGNMSGSPTTTEDNCMVNATSNSMTLDELDVDYAQCVYGDDALITTSKPVKFEDFAKMKSKFGLIVKPEFDCSIIKDHEVNFLSRKNQYIKGLHYSVSSAPGKLLVSACCSNTRDVLLQFTKLCAIREVLFGCEPQFTQIDEVIRRIIRDYDFPHGFVASNYRSRKLLLASRLSSSCS